MWSWSWLVYQVCLKEGKWRWEIKHPCLRCFNSFFQNAMVVRDHIIAYRVVQSHTVWYYHGEKVSETQLDTTSGGWRGRWWICGWWNAKRWWDIRVNNRVFSKILVNETIWVWVLWTISKNKQQCKQIVYKVKDLEQSIHEGSKCSKLSAVIQLLNVKTLGRWSTESFSMLLWFLTMELHPCGSQMLEYYYEKKQVVRDRSWIIL